jgi:hypothetical protein
MERHPTAPATDLDAAVNAIVTHLRTVWPEHNARRRDESPGGPVVKIVVEILDSERGDRDFGGGAHAPAVALHAYNPDGVRIDARYLRCWRDVRD